VRGEERCQTWAVRVERIGFTPVKGGRHVGHEDVQFALTGPVGDRVFCLVDPKRNQVLRTVENPGLLQVITRWHDGVLSVELPTEHLEGVPVGTGSMREVDYWGREATVEIVHGPWAAGYSRLLGHEVELARTLTSGEVVYGAAVSIVTTQALRWLVERVGHHVEPERFRSTLLIDSGLGACRTENAWVGRHLRVGEARLHVIGAVPRCTVIDLDPSTGLRNRSLLGALADPHGGEITFGLDAVVLKPARVRVGDTVQW
jgi:uncharacterized protein